MLEQEKPKSEEPPKRSFWTGLVLDPDFWAPIVSALIEALIDVIFNGLL